MKLLLALLVGVAAATSPQPSKLHASRIAAKPALSKALELRGGGVVPGDIVVKTTQALFGGYGLALLFTPELMTTMHFDEEPTAITNFWARGSAIPLLAVSYLLTLVSPEAAIKFCAAYIPLMGLVYPWNAEFMIKLACKPLHKFPTIAFAVLSVAGFLAL